MTIKLISITMAALLAVNFNANAFHINNDTVKAKKGEFKRHHKIKSHIRSIIRTHMLENGYITQDEINLRKAERELTRIELKTLKETGNVEGLAAKKAELRAKRKVHKAAIKAYVNNNEELKAEIKEKTKALRQKMKERRQKASDE